MEKVRSETRSAVERAADSTLASVRAENEKLLSEFSTIKQTEEKLVGIIDRLTREVVQVKEELKAVRALVNTTENDLATTNAAVASDRQSNRRELEDKESVIIRFINAKNDELLKKHAELIEQARRDMTGSIYTHLEDLLQLNEFKTQSARDAVTTILTTEQKLKRLDEENIRRIADVTKLRSDLLGEMGHLMTMMQQQQQQQGRGFGRR